MPVRLALGLGVLAKLGGGDGQAHAIGDGGGVVDGLAGLAVFALRIQRLARRLAHLARGAAAEQLGRDHRDEIDDAAHRLERQDDPQPVHLAMGAHHVDAQGDRDQERQADQRQRQREHGRPRDVFLVFLARVRGRQPRAPNNRLFPRKRGPKLTLNLSRWPNACPTAAWIPAFAGKIGERDQSSLAGLRGSALGAGARRITSAW
jgi:hypothetical protein